MGDETPRLPSSFPRSPSTVVRSRRPPPPPPTAHGLVPPHRNGDQAMATPSSTTDTKPNPPPDILQNPTASLPPVIPLDAVDAPTQRLYAVGLFVLLQAWKFYDIAGIYTTDGDSISELWFCLKWLVLDGCFFWFLPLLRIPWLTFTPNFTLCTIAILSVFDIFLSLKYQIPFTTILGALWKFVYDRELSISERSVKWYDIVNNNSHIQGKYTVHILPEGAVKLNPDANCFCLGEGSPSITLPIRINGTQPIHIQLTRIDFETKGAEVIDISPKEIKKMLKRAEKGEDPKIQYLPYTIKQLGLYRLAKVTDVSQLDVRIYRSEALVVSCPKATLKVPPLQMRHRCKGDISDLALQVEGLAPLQLTYNREIKGKPTVFTVQSIHPENFESPLLGGFSSDGTLAEQGDLALEWAQRQNIIVPLNESLSSSGDWVYSIDKVTDACGNSIDYHSLSEDGGNALRRGSLSRALAVHERPVVRFRGCDPQNPMDLPRGISGQLPIQLSSGHDDDPYSVKVIFTPYDKLQLASEHAPDAVTKDYTLKTHTQPLLVKEPGLYSMKSITSEFCSGDVMEPASCLVITPSEPSMAMRSDEILDKCTGSSIGLTIDLTLVGAPPFDLSYRLIKDGGAPVVKTLSIERMRHQVQFTPADAGHYAYEFFGLRDKNYANVKIDPRTNRVEQTVKPMAGATFLDPNPRKKSCIQEPVEFEVKMQGMPPLTLNYELIHNGKRTKMTEPNITTGIHTIKTPPLANGGEYALALTTVVDDSGCQIFVGSEAKINVRWQRPKAKFSPMEGKMSIRALEGKSIDIPLRLTGESPWDVTVRNIDRDEPAKHFKFSVSNAYLTVRDPGRYKLEAVHDSGCPGTISEPEGMFEISWIARPMVKLADSMSTVQEGNIFSRREVCEGDEDAVELAFVGSPPFTIDYERTFKPDGPDARRSPEVVPQKLTAGLGIATVRLETSQAGIYQYQFSRIIDSLYDDPRESLIRNPIVLQQVVHSRPTTSFANPNKVYKYCLDAGAGDDIISIQLHGVAPFSLTINIKHFSTGKSDVINIPHVDSDIFNFRIPRHALTLGSHAVSVLKVKDSRGCVRKTTEAPHVIVAVADMPSISPFNQRTDYCVGDRISFSLAGVPPFAVEYEWNGVLMKAQNQPSEFVRVAEKPGNFTITGLQDSASDCKVNEGLTNIIHEVPSVKISEGHAVVRGIPEGEQAEIHFKFFGTPPFTFTYTRSEIAKKGIKARILEMHSHITDSYTYSMFASQEGTYEVVSIEDKYCGYAAGKGRRG